MAPFAQVSVAPRHTRCVAVRAVDRRHVLASIAAGAMLIVPRAEAINVPSQDSTGGATKPGSMPKNTSEASMSSYTMEGLKKRGIKADKRKELLSELKQKAQAGKYTD